MPPQILVVALSFEFTEAIGTNDQGLVVGFFDDDTGRHGFQTDGNFNPIDFPAALPTTPFGINNDGSIAGLFVDVSGTQEFLRDLNCTFGPIDIRGSSP